MPERLTYEQRIAKIKSDDNKKRRIREKHKGEALLARDKSITAAKNGKKPTPHDMVRRLERQLAEEYGVERGSVVCDPLKFLLMLMAGRFPDDVYHDFKEDEKNMPASLHVPMDMRMEAAKISIPFVHAKTTEISGPGGGAIPITQAVVDMTDMMRDPVLRKSVEDMQIQLANRRQLALEASRLEPSTEDLAEPAKLGSLKVVEPEENT